MTDLSSQILPRLEAHKIDPLPLNDDLLLPFYEGLSLVNIPGTVAHLLDAPDFGKPALDKTITQQLDGPYEKVVLLLVDAMGDKLLQRLMKNEKDLVWRKYFDRAIYSPLTSVCPSTTASALTTLWTGEAPAAHGIIGYEMWAKEFGMVMNNIHHSAATSRGDTGGLVRSGFEPQTFMGKPLFGTHLVQNNISASTFIHSSIAHSGLSVMQMRDVDVQTFRDEADLCVSLADYVNSRHGIREYIYVYYSDVDSLMHHYSAEDRRVTLQFDAFSKMFEKAFLNELSSTAAKDTLLIMAADHGSKTTPRDPRYDLTNHSELMDCFVMQPTCEHRLAFFYVKPGRVEAVRDYFKNTWPDDFIVIDSGTALEKGLFGKGPFPENVRDRLGDLIAVSLGSAYLWWAPTPNHMAGRHGGLSRDEMLVPFYALPLDRLD